MRKILILLTMTLMLSSCIEVDDMGTYVNKTFVDQRLIGNWKRTALGPKDLQEGAQKLTFVANGNNYKVWIYPSDKADKQPAGTFTVKIGPFNFFVFGDPHFKMTGINNHIGPQLVRYDVMGNKLEIYNLNPVKFNDYVASQYPQKEKINYFGNSCIGFKLLDDEVAKLISNVPADYWDLDMRYERIFQV